MGALGKVNPDFDEGPSLSYKSKVLAICLPWLRNDYLGYLGLAWPALGIAKRLF